MISTRAIKKRRVVKPRRPYRTLESLDGAMRLIEGAQEYARAQVAKGGKVPPHAIVFVRKDPHSGKWHDEPTAFGLDDDSVMFTTQLSKAMRDGCAIGAIMACNVSIKKRGKDQKGVMLRLVHESLSRELGWLAHVSENSRGATLGPFEEYELRDSLLRRFLNVSSP